MTSYELIPDSASAKTGYSRDGESMRGVSQNRKSRLREIASVAGRHAIWLLLCAACLLFSIASPHFLSIYNISDVLLQSSILGFLAIGLTPVMVNGNIDLSISATMGFAACLVIGLQTYGLAVGIFATVVVGAGLGFLNGSLVEKAGVNSFVVTLAAMIGIRGLGFLYTGDTSISAIDPRFVDYGTITIGPISLVVVVFASVFMVVHWLLSKTIHGRNAYAIGGNRSAAVNAGIAVPSHVVTNFTLCGAMASLAGIAMAAQLGAATPSYGAGYELWAVAAVVLGGTALSGGTGNLIGTVGGVLTLAVIRNGLDIVQVQSFYAQVIIGVVLIAAIAVDKGINRPSSRVG